MKSKLLGLAFFVAVGLGVIVTLWTRGLDPGAAPDLDPARGPDPLSAADVAESGKRERDGNTSKRPDVEEEQVGSLRVLLPSEDWARLSGHLQLMHDVNGDGTRLVEVCATKPSIDGDAAFKDLAPGAYRVDATWGNANNHYWHGQAFATVKPGVEAVARVVATIGWPLTIRSRTVNPDGSPVGMPGAKQIRLVINTLLDGKHQKNNAISAFLMVEHDTTVTMHGVSGVTMVSLSPSQASPPGWRRVGPGILLRRVQVDAARRIDLDYTMHRLMKMSIVFKTPSVSALDGPVRLTLYDPKRCWAPQQEDGVVVKGRWTGRLLEGDYRAVIVCGDLVYWGPLQVVREGHTETIGLGTGAFVEGYMEPASEGTVAAFPDSWAGNGSGVHPYSAGCKKDGAFVIGPVPKSGRLGFFGCAVTKRGGKLILSKVSR